MTKGIAVGFASAVLLLQALIFFNHLSNSLMHSVLSYKMASGRGLRDQAAGVIATFNGFGNGHKLKLLDSGHKCVAAKPGVGREPVA